MHHSGRHPEELMPRHLHPAYLTGARAALCGADYFTACPFAAGSERDDWCAGFNGVVVWGR